jgi:hypothetical protein
MSLQRDYTYEDAKRYRDEQQCSLLEAVHIAHENKDFDLLCDVVRELIQRASFE